ncbi:MAG: hypothetical protein AMJ88_15115 [Anaerolineae bacterium SM23_ 63]|nr:MAG: hypothetical protein AMJ88_15115 [Anaerolineae bacterium SM23_ 63]
MRRGPLGRIPYRSGPHSPRWSTTCIVRPLPDRDRRARTHTRCVRFQGFAVYAGVAQGLSLQLVQFALVVVVFPKSGLKLL